jgi:hypothetical protein
MKTTSILSLTALTLLAAACARDGGPTPGPTPTAAKVPVAQAQQVPGDVKPSRLVAVHLPPPPAEPVISASMPGLPKRTFTIEQVIEPSIRHDYGRVVTAASGPIVLPISTVEGTRVIVTSRDPRISVDNVHLRDSSGKVLDRGKDSTNVIPVLRHPATGPSPKGQADGATPTSPSKRGAIADATLQPAQQETAFKPLMTPRRILSIDVPASPGPVTLTVPPELLKAGLELDIQEPGSPITLSGAPLGLNYGFGEVGKVEYTLLNGSTPISDAVITGTVELPGGQRFDNVTFSSKGQGKYLAEVPLAGSDLQHIGVWHVRAKVTGAVSGIAFERDIENGFGYAPAHSQILAVAQPEIVRGADSVIDDIKFDVDVESIAADRLGVSAMLVYRDAAGAEHAVAQAETSANVTPGQSTITLHFQAKDVALANIDGPFYLRSLTLMSHAYATTQHHIGRALDLSTPAIAAKEIRYPALLSPAAEELIEMGELDKR